MTPPQAGAADALKEGLMELAKEKGGTFPAPEAVAPAAAAAAAPKKAAGWFGR